MLAKIGLHCGKCSRAFKGMDWFISHDTISHGFSRQLINGVVNKWQFLFVFDDILRNFPVFSLNKTLCILEVIQKIFVDITNLDGKIALFNFQKDANSSQWFDIDNCVLHHLPFIKRKKNFITIILHLRKYKSEFQ